MEVLEVLDVMKTDGVRTSHLLYFNLHHFAETYWRIESCPSMFLLNNFQPKSTSRIV